MYRQILWSVAALGLVCCNSQPDVQPSFVLPTDLSELSQETFFDHPFPSDLRLSEGRVVVAGWPNPRSAPLLDQYIAYADRRLDGFSIMGSGFMRFDGPLDPASLPAKGESTSASSSVQLIDVDPASPDLGQRHPIYVEFRRDAGAYWPSNTLSFIPVPGYPLRPRTRYALVVTEEVRSESGGEVVASESLKQALGLRVPTSDGAERAAALFEPVVRELEKAGVARDSVVQFTSFTTNDPTAELSLAAAQLPNAIEAPTADPAAWSVRAAMSNHIEYEGSFGPCPDFQAGSQPFGSFGDGGSFEFDEQGQIVLQRTYDARFSLSVPTADNCPMPAEGYPIVLFAHGTGGDYRSYVNSGTARELGKRCIAVMGVDQILHGTRPGAPSEPGAVELLFFNFNNVEAARTNGRQSALDEVQRARLFTESKLTVPASVSLSGVEVRFDASKLMYFGHSQGALNGPMFLAIDDAALGGVFSGGSGNLQITLNEKTSPAPSVADAVKTLFLQLSLEEHEEVGLIYPPFALAQLLVDPVDPISYARDIVREPRVGAAKSVLMTEGVLPNGTGDTFAPPRCIEAMANAVGLPLESPAIWSPPDALFGGLEPTKIPAGGLSGNVGGGQATGMLSQFAPTTDDGHFVAFDIDEATEQTTSFLRALADDPKGRVMPAY